MSELVAIVTCVGEFVDPDSPILLAALDEVGVNAELVAWDDPTVEWDRYSLNIIRSTWNYPARVAPFREWVARTPRLVNGPEVVKFSMDKHYLGALAAAGVAVVESHFVDVGTTAVFPEGSFVVKPCVGAGSIDAERYGPSDHERALEHVARLHASGRDALVQPYVHSVDVDGEIGVIFIDREFSHAVRKGAMLNVSALDRNNLFRMEQMSVVDIDEKTSQFARSVLDAAGFDDLLYARVDLVRTASGPAVMELELIEPSLFFYVVPGVVSRLARAISRRLDRNRSH